MDGQNDLTLWTVVWTCLIIVPTALIWGFSIFDIFRRYDLAGWAKAAWLLAVVVFPVAGTVIYLIARPALPTEEYRAAVAAERHVDTHYAAGGGTRELQILADLHDRNKLSDAEYHAQKTHVLTRTATEAEAQLGQSGIRSTAR